MTYAELITKIRDYCEVDSNVFTSTIVDVNTFESTSQ